MSSNIPNKLLEINLISARDLPPLAKVLRTFAVAYVTPDNKITTKIDHHGHTNPTWNQKMEFRVDHEFMKQESSTLTVEIYNLAWLRDLPIGTARLNLNTLLSPPMSKRNSNRRVSLKVCRPNGHLKGTVNLTVHVVDIATAAPAPAAADDELSLRSSKIIAVKKNHKKKREVSRSPKKIPDLEIKIAPKTPSICSSPESIRALLPDLESVTRPLASTISVNSLMKPLPPESEADLNLAFFRAKAKDYGSEIFDNWTEAGDVSGDEKTLCARTESICSTSESETRTVTSSGSELSSMRPLPPEVADDLEREFYRAKAAESGSEAFENWTEAGDMSSDDKIPGREISPGNESICSTPAGENTLKPASEFETRAVASSSSELSLPRTLPPEVDDLKREFYRAKAAEYGGEIFEKWTEAGGGTSSYDETPATEITPINESACSKHESEPETKTITSSGSEFSLIGPIPPEVADDMKRGFYMAEAADFASESWSLKEPGTKTITSSGSEFSSIGPIPPEVADDMKRGFYMAEAADFASDSWSSKEPGTKTITSSGSEFSLVRPIPPEVADDMKRGFYMAEAAEFASDGWSSKEPGTKTITSSGSEFSLVRPIPPEVADDMKRGFYMAEAAEFASDGWSSKEPGTKTITSSGSEFSLVRPIPPEVADDMKRGFYMAEAAEFESEGWTVKDTASNETESKAEKEEWKAEGVNNAAATPMNELTLDLRRKRPEKTARKRFKIFGINAYGLEFSFICGSNMMRKNKKVKK